MSLMPSTEGVFMSMGMAISPLGGMPKYRFCRQEERNLSALAFRFAKRKENAMSKRLSLMLCFGAFLFLTGVGFAQQSGTTTGPAAGTNTEPSTAIQKQQDGASGPPGSPAAAGHPGVEAKPGTEGGKTPQGGSKSNEGEQRAR
jgi:hypothetical protein